MSHFVHNLPDENGEATICRLCNDVAEDAIQAKCKHIFDRECIKQYLNTAIEQTVCPRFRWTITLLTCSSPPAQCAMSL